MGNNRKIQVQTGNLSEVCNFIKSDWKYINRQNEQLHTQIKKLSEKLI